jgi:hypothetical protein
MEAMRGDGQETVLVITSGCHEGGIKSHGGISVADLLQHRLEAPRYCKALPMMVVN